jgi:transglutaminase-like putative cysteine protease
VISIPAELRAELIDSNAHPGGWLAREPGAHLGSSDCRPWAADRSVPARRWRVEVDGEGTRLRNSYSCDLESPSGAVANPLDHSLFKSRRGHCAFYSSAMAIMLRSLGVPTRNVTGFIGGTYNRFGNY